MNQEEMVTASSELAPETMPREWRTLRGSEIGSWLRDKQQAGGKLSPVVAAMFMNGSNLARCDSATVLMISGKIVAIATVAPDFQNNSCEVVGFYVEPEWRRKGIGSELLAAVVQSIGRVWGCLPIRFDVTSTRMLRMLIMSIARYPNYFGGVLPYDHTAFVDMDLWLE